MVRTTAWLPPVLLFAAAFLVSWIYQTPPSLGDDLNYWGLAMDLHQGKPDAWNDSSFHDLRWPVWGVIWLLQIPFGFGALSYYLQPMVYLGAGAVLVYAIGRHLKLDVAFAFLGGLLLLFHPLIDSVIDRPMPDLSEGFWVCLAFFAWLKMVAAGSNGARVGFALVIGLALAIGQANRITGVFAIPMLVFATLACYPRKILWLALAGVFAGIFVVIEAGIYHGITGDFFHSINANLGATGRKGTEAIAFWELPIRFIPSLFRRHTDVIFTILCLLGLLAAPIFRGKPGRALAIYAVVYFLTYSCAVQSLFPLRPLVRDGERFLASLSFPFSILAAVGLSELIRSLPAVIKAHPAYRFVACRPGWILMAIAVGLTFLAARPFRGENFLREFGTTMRETPAGSVILSHDGMRHVAFLADRETAQGFEWHLSKNLLRPDAETLALVDQADEIWFNRKLIWTTTRKASEYDRLDGIGKIAPYLRPPMDDWSPKKAIPKGNVPDFTFLKRRDASMPDAAEDAEWIRTKLLPPLELPQTWQIAGRRPDPVQFDPVEIPESLRGRTVFVALRYSSDQTEPIRVGVAFYKGEDRILDLNFKPYFFPESSEDFFFATIPKDAETMSIRFRIYNDTEWITVEKLDIYVEPAPR